MSVEMKREKVIVFGTGAVARRFAYEHRNCIEIVYFLDNYYKENAYASKPVYKPEEREINELKQYKIVVCSTYYPEIAMQLDGLGLEEYTNYIPGEIYGKKIVACIGNCHMAVIRQMLKCNKEFYEQYGIYNIPEIYNFKEYSFVQYERLLTHADIVIYQDISNENKIDVRFGYSYIEERKGKACKAVKILNTYGLGKIYYPHFTYENPYNRIEKGLPFGYFQYGDCLLDDFIRQGYGKEEIIQKLADMEAKADYSCMAEEIFEKYQKRDALCDIQIMDYIIKHYKQKLLFYDVAHPVNEILWEKCKRILKVLGISNTYFEKGQVGSLAAFTTPIYPMIKEQLKLEFDTDVALGGVDRLRLTTNLMSFEEYIEQYIFWCGDSIKSTMKD